MSAFQTLIDLDKQWLLAINGAHALWADALMWQVSAAYTWIPMYMLMLYLLAVKTRGMRSKWQVGQIAVPTLIVLLVGMVVAIGGADLICAKIIKPIVARPRPTHDAEIGALVHIVNGYTGGPYGFCSNHAANTMACAVLFTKICSFGRPHSVRMAYAAVMYTWVAINCYSRMYLGVHYPLDIVAGLIVGTLMAYGVWAALRYVLNHACTEEYAHHGARV